MRPAGFGFEKCDGFDLSQGRFRHYHVMISCRTARAAAEKTHSWDGRKI